MKTVKCVLGCVVLVCLVGACATTGKPGPVYLLNKSGVSASPNKLYSVLTAPEVVDGKTVNKLVLLKKDGAEKVELLTYERAVSVAWSPSGNRLMINTYSAHDSGGCWICIPAQQEVINLTEEFAKTPDGKLAGGGNAYIEGKKWKGNDAILVHFHGRGIAKNGAFSRWYTYKLNEGFKKNAFGNTHFRLTFPDSM